MKRDKDRAYGADCTLKNINRERFCVMNIEDNETQEIENKLYMKLHEAEEAVKDDNEWMSLDELKNILQVDR